MDQVRAQQVLSTQGVLPRHHTSAPCQTVQPGHCRTFPTSLSVLGLLGVAALVWAQAMSKRHAIKDLAFDELKNQLKLVFDHPAFAVNVADRILSIR